MDELQRLVERLAHRLDRPVAVDDIAFRLLAYTAHDDDVDPVRTQIVLSRKAPPAVAAWVNKHGVARAKGPIRVDGNEQLGLQPRVCIPVRGHGVHFGYLWLIDPGQTLSPDQMRLAEAAAAEAGDLLFREQISRELDVAREGELVRDLLADDRTTWDLAAQQLIESGLFAFRRGVVVLVLQPLLGPGAVIEDELRTALTVALTDAVSRVPRREVLRLVRPRHAVLVVSRAAFEENPDLPQWLHARAARVLTDVEVVVGVGSHEAALPDAAGSYAHALRAARLAEHLPRFRPVVSWGTMGVYAMLAALPIDELPHEALHPAFETLRAAEPELLLTVEAFLDRAGDTGQVATDLHVHRATVYTRVRRVEELTGLTLADGETRLALHLSIKLARLAGLI